MQVVLDKAVEMYRRHRSLEESNRAFTALPARPGVWKPERAERDAWEVTLADDLAKWDMPEPSRREIWTVDLNPIRGQEPAGIRPGLVISVDPFNHGPAGLVVVLPLTRVTKGIPWLLCGGRNQAIIPIMQRPLSLGDVVSEVDFRFPPQDALPGQSPTPP